MNLLSNPDLLLYNKQKNKEPSTLVLRHTSMSMKCFVLDHNYSSTTTTLTIIAYPVQVHEILKSFI